MTNQPKVEPLSAEELAETSKQHFPITFVRYPGLTLCNSCGPAAWPCPSARLLSTVEQKDRELQEQITAERDAWVEAIWPGSRDTDMGKEARAEGPSYVAGVLAEANALIRESIEITADAYERVDEMVVALRQENAELRAALKTAHHALTEILTRVNPAPYLVAARTACAQALNPPSSAPEPAREKLADFATRLPEHLAAIDASRRLTAEDMAIRFGPVPEPEKPREKATADERTEETETCRVEVEAGGGGGTGPSGRTSYEYIRYCGKRLVNGVCPDHPAEATCREFDGVGYCNRCGTWKSAHPAGTGKETGR